MNKKTTLTRSASSLDIRLPSTSLTVDPELVLEYWGPVRQATNEKIFTEVKRRMSREPEKELYLLVTCAGGPSGVGMSFYDSLRRVLKPRLTTVGMGDVDSSGIIIFLSGTTRYVSPNTTLLLHPAGRRVTVQSDNPAYPDWPDCDIDDIHCIGRVIWAGRKIG